MVEIPIRFVAKNIARSLAASGKDAAPVLGERLGVFGAGVVGALTAALLSRFEAMVPWWAQEVGDQ
jgi:phosphoglycerate dehydrogenase-like enzyme